MSKLLQRLSDGARSGVYRAAHERDIVDALRGSELGLARIDLAGADSRDAALERIARALAFPKWFGGNWDALEDCLTDLSWSTAAGHVLLIEGAGGQPADERGILIDILTSAASYWSERKRPFFAVFIGAVQGLPDLYRERQ